MRALGRRPTTLERWPKGVHPGIVLATREKGGGDAFFQKRVPGALRTTWRRRASSSRRGATPTRSARPRSRSSAGRRRWGRSRSIRGRCAATTSITRTSCGSTSTRSRARTSTTPCASPPRRASSSTSSATTGFPKTSGGRGIHIYVRIEPRWTFTDVRHAAIAFGRELERRLPGEVTTKWWKEERGERIFVDYNQNARDRTIASAYSIRPKPGAPVSAPVTWDELAGRRARRTSRSRRCRRASPRSATATPRSTTPRTRSSRCSTCTSATRQGDMPYPPDYPKMPGEPKRVQPSRDRDRKKAQRQGRRRTSALGRLRQLLRAALRPGWRAAGRPARCRRRAPRRGRRSPARGRSGPCPCAPAGRPTRP